MARKRSKRQQQVSTNTDDFVQVDNYYIPEPLVEMYLALKEAVADETISWLEAKGLVVERLYDEEVGEVITGTLNERPLFHLALSPEILSQAQQARDKAQLDKFLENYFIV